MSFIIHIETDKEDRRVLPALLYRYAQSMRNKDLEFILVTVNKSLGCGYLQRCSVLLVRLSEG